MPRSYKAFDIETVPDISGRVRAHDIDPWDDEALKATRRGIEARMATIVPRRQAPPRQYQSEFSIWRRTR